ncbi:hypothetical protein EVAR_75627_1 [Eumeta japonica]|uniref:Uncharacterized protein n=1 Tax=Eumeta variegata TaxID=151549 RepID=A0A4C1U010_EUMVA|nr:hypothetical protein EVAR_75627_1 [Eumeta japonica]
MAYGGAPGGRYRRVAARAALLCVPIGFLFNLISRRGRGIRAEAQYFTFYDLNQIVDVAYSVARLCTAYMPSIYSMVLCAIANCRLGGAPTTSGVSTVRASGSKGDSSWRTDEQCEKGSDLKKRRGNRAK